MEKEKGCDNLSDLHRDNPKVSMGQVSRSKTNEQERSEYAGL